jgi:alkylhydroperoxidase/carboxymuconolactone decarboxylase family protein YurZ
MKKLPKPPETYESFVQRFPKLKEAWEQIAEAGKDGPLDQKTIRLVKLGIAVGAQKEGAIHSGVRKALSLNIAQEEIEQVIALAAGTIGLPSTVAVYSWIQDVLEKKGR